MTNFVADEERLFHREAPDPEPDWDPSDRWPCPDDPDWSDPRLCFRCLNYDRTPEGCSCCGADYSAPQPEEEL